MARENTFVKVLGFRLFSGVVDLIPYNSPGKILINTMNPNSFTISRRNELFKNALENSDYLIQDGQYFALAPLLLKGKYVSKVSGTDVFYSMMEKANTNKGKVFFLGASEDTVEKMKLRTSVDYPNIQVAGFSPPYRDRFSDKENQEILMEINKFSPDVLFVGMTAPKQEIWASENFEKVNARIICSVGAVFDWYARVRTEISRFWVKLGLEWLIRTIQRPELLKRYPDNLFFFWLLVLNILRIRKD